YGTPIGLVLKVTLPASLWGESTVVLRVPGESQAGRASLAPPTPGGVAGELLAWLDRRGGEASMGTAQRALGRPLWEVAGRLARSGALELALHPPRTEGNRASTRVVRLTGSRLTLLQREEVFAGRPRQRALYETLEQLDRGGGAAVEHLTRRLGFGPALLRALARAKLAEIIAVDRVRDPFAGEPGTPPPAEATPAQCQAIAAIEALAPGDGALLFGVTGSGKTLVYLEVIRRAPGSGQRDPGAGDRRRGAGAAAPRPAQAAGRRPSASTSRAGGSPGSPARPRGARATLVRSAGHGAAPDPGPRRAGAAAAQSP